MNDAQLCYLTPTPLLPTLYAPFHRHPHSITTTTPPLTPPDTHTKQRPPQQQQLRQQKALTAPTLTQQQHPQLPTTPACLAVL